MTTDEQLEALARTVGEALTDRGWTIATAESCTGGWIAKAFTDVPGSSAWFGAGFVTYSNAAKMELLAVPAGTLERHGAVSEPVVIAMAERARELGRADLAVAVSGIAGPGGGSPDKPVGTVWFARAGAAGADADVCRFAGDRDAVRRQSVAHALNGILAWLRSSG